MAYAGNELGKERLTSWQERYKEHPGFKYDHACLSELRGLRCRIHLGPFRRYNWRGEAKPCRLPYSDHTSLWKDRETGELVYVTQPYGTSNDSLKFTVEDLAEMAAFCNDYGLKMRIDSTLSWHYPPATTCIMVTRYTQNGGPACD